VLEEQVEERTHQLREEKEKVELINEEVLSQKSIIEAKNKDITDSINYAKNIQEALMPSVNILYSSFNGSFVLYLPKDIVSGDFYWFAQRGGKKFFAAVDCTGHGVPGAFMSIIGNSVLHEIVAEKNIFQPSKILDELHNGVKEALNANKGETERRDGMDIALCAYNEETGILEYAGANRALWLFRENNRDKPLETTKPNKFPIGGLELEEKRMFSHHEIRINKGDCAYVFTDGYADQFGGEKGKKFMVGNLQKALEQMYTSPMPEQKAFLQKTFLKWRGEHEQIDDVLVIGVKF
jgi:serine phosphatase RsbU (regulator of sigma subunit)